jgi:hypothetical protein
MKTTLPSGKRTKNYGKPPFSMKSDGLHHDFPIERTIFNGATLW